MLRLRMGLTLLLVVGWCSLGGCPPGGVTDDGGTAGGETLKVNFNPAGGNFAIATDSQGNQYTFKAREDGGDTAVTEANIVTTDGRTLKVSLDSSGRPVNVRLSDNTAADLVYDASTGDVSIRLTDSGGNVISTARGIKSNAKSSEVRARQRAAWGKRATWQDGDSDVDTLQKGLAKCEEIIESITDPNSNPSTPLSEDSSNETVKRLTTNLKSVAKIASVAEVAEVASEELGEDVTADEVPAAIQALAGQTFKLFDVDPNLVCLEFTDIANLLTFDGNGILMSEFDRHLVFPDFSSGSTQEAGITINYAAMTEINLTTEDIGFNLTAQPVFTGTQLDDNGKITIERRFHAHLEFPVELFGEATAEAHKLFDIAFVNGQLADDVLELDLVLVDLDAEGDDGAVGERAYPIGRLRYHNQNVRQPDRMWTCEWTQEDIRQQQEEDPTRGITCPGNAEVYEEFDVTFEPGDADLSVFQLDWYISSGTGYVQNVNDEGAATVVGTASGLLEMTLLIHDMRESVEQTLLVYTCVVAVGDVGGEPPAAEDLDWYVPDTFVLYETAEIKVFGTLLSEFDYMEWFVTGTDWYYVYEWWAAQTELEFWELPSDVDLEFFTVWFYGYDSETGAEVLLWKDVAVTDSGEVEYGEELPEEDYSDIAGTYAGELTSPPGWAHTFEFEIDEYGDVWGTSTWGAGQFDLVGYAYADGYVYFEDNAGDFGSAVGIYEGYWDTDMGHFMGAYYEDGWDNYIGDWTADVAGS